MYTTTWCPIQLVGHSNDQYDYLAYVCAGGAPSGSPRIVSYNGPAASTGCGCSACLTNPYVLDVPVSGDGDPPVNPTPVVVPALANNGYPARWSDTETIAGGMTTMSGFTAENFTLTLPSGANVAVRFYSYSAKVGTTSSFAVAGGRQATTATNPTTLNSTNAYIYQRAPYYYQVVPKSAIGTLNPSYGYHVILSP